MLITVMKTKTHSRVEELMLNYAIIKSDSYVSCCRLVPKVKILYYIQLRLKMTYNFFGYVQGYIWFL